MLPTITEYRDALLFEGAMKKYQNLRLVLDEKGNPVFSSGNYSVVFKMQDKETGKYFAVKCFTREQENRRESYKLISKHLNANHSPYLVHYEYLAYEIWVNSHLAGEGEFPALVMEWVEGVTMGVYLRKLCDWNNKYGILHLANRFDQMALWLLKQPFAHGDLKTDNILIESNGQLRLIDYDGMFTPEMEGQLSRELGSPGFRHPKRTYVNFNTHIDDFSILLISFSIRFISTSIQLNNIQFTEYLIFDETSLLNNYNLYDATIAEYCNKSILHKYEYLLLMQSLEGSAAMKLYFIDDLLLKLINRSNSFLTKVELHIKSHQDQITRRRSVGLIDSKDQLVIPCIYDDIKYYEGGYALIRRKILLDNENIFIDNYINIAGDELVPLKYIICGLSEELILVKFDNKYGFLNISGYLVIPLVYDHASVFSEGLAAVSIGEKWGFIDIKGVKAIDFHYNEVERFSCGVAAVKIDDDWNIIDRNGKLLARNVSKSSFIFENGLAILYNQSQCIINTKGEKIIDVDYFVEIELKKFGFIILEISYDECVLEEYENPNPAIWDKDLMYEFRNIPEALPMGVSERCSLYSLYCYENELIPFILNSPPIIINNNIIELDFTGWGIIDRAGNIILPCVFDELVFWDNRIRCKKDLRYGLLDYKLRWIVGLDFNYIYSFSEGLSMVRKEYHIGYIDSDGIIKVPIKFRDGKEFKNGVASVNYKSEWIIINNEGNIVSEDNDFNFLSDENVHVDMHQKIQTLELSNKLSFNEETIKDEIKLINSDESKYSFDEVIYLDYNIYKVRRGEKWGCFDMQNYLITPLKYDEIGIFNEELAQVRCGSYWGFIDRFGIELITPKYIAVGGFKNGICKVYSKGTFRGEVVDDNIIWGE